MLELKRKIALIECVAALAVFGIHSGFFLNKYLDVPDRINSVLNYGQDGLWIFYILSGLLVWKSYASVQGNVLVYIKKRFFRIVPLYWVWISVLFFVYIFTKSDMFPRSYCDWIRHFLGLQFLIPTRGGVPVRM